MKDLPALLHALDPDADLAQRHVWLIKLFEWIRDDQTSTEAAVARVQAFIDAVQLQPELQGRLQAWWQTLLQTVDITTLLADFGFAPRTAFVSELAERVRRKLLPSTPETEDAFARPSGRAGAAMHAVSFCLSKRARAGRRVLGPIPRRPFPTCVST